MAMHASSPENAYWFGLGSNARIAGQPLSSCPRGENDGNRMYWRLGWNHVHWNWAKDGAGKGRVKPIPAVILEAVSA